MSRSSLFPWQEKTSPRRSRSVGLLILVFILAACQAAPAVPNLVNLADNTPTPAIDPSLPTPVATRPAYAPGQLVDYIAQTGDTLPALAAHFNTSIKEIREANPVIPQDATTMPPGFPMKIPIYYETLWGSSYQIIPDSLFVFGPAQRGFDAEKFVNAQPGWFKDYSDYTGGKKRSGGDIVAYTAINYSISPRLLLALVEYQTGALSGSKPFDPENQYPLELKDSAHQGLTQQIILVANMLNNAYYAWRTGSLHEFDHLDSRLERLDPWQNAATAAIQYYFSRILDGNEYVRAISGSGLAGTYAGLFGDPWANVQPHIPGSLRQPALQFPFPAGLAWAFTGGPHTAWGSGDPFAAIDFAPPAAIGGCLPTEQMATAMADGVIVRTDTGIAALDLDNDGDERTGWVIFYLHLATASIPPVGTHLKAGDPIGFPSCEGGHATGTHVHIARKYNGEWILADGPLAFDLEGWIAQNGTEAYQGNLVRYGHVVRACDCSDKASQIQAEIP